MDVTVLGYLQSGRFAVAMAYDDRVGRVFSRGHCSFTTRRASTYSNLRAFSLYRKGNQLRPAIVKFSGETLTELAMALVRS